MQALAGASFILLLEELDLSLVTCILLVLILLSVLIIGSVVLHDIEKDVPKQDAQNQEEPVNVDELERKDEREDDWLGDPALVLLIWEAQLIGTHCFELGEHRPQDLEVQVVAGVEPDDDEAEEEGDDQRRVEVVQGLGEGQEEVRNIHRDVDCKPHPGEMEAVRQTDQKHRHNVVEDQLLEVLAGLLQAEHQHDRLLGPETGLEEVVELEEPEVALVRVVEVELPRVEVPHRCFPHDVEPQRTRDPVVHDRVRLLHESLLLAALFQPKRLREGFE